MARRNAVGPYDHSAQVCGRRRCRASHVVRFMLYVACGCFMLRACAQHDVAAGMRGRRPHQPSTSRRTMPTTPPTMCACARVRMPPRVLSRRVVCALSSSRGSVVLILFVCLCFGAQSDRSADSAPPDPSRRAHAAPTPCVCVHARVRGFFGHLSCVGARMLASD
jgi:hypothetical protein